MTVATASKPTAADATAQEYLVFRLGDEEYGIDILKVQEIRGSDRLTRIP
ncbi:chemotaxis protein CheW, partial [Klebsiella pneumoniae]